MLKILYIALFLPVSLMAQEESFYYQLNRFRVGHNLKPLEIDSTLQAGCEQWLLKMGDKLRHSGGYYGEVLAKGCKYDLECWVYSEPHRKIIASPKYTVVGYMRINGVACARFK